MNREERLNQLIDVAEIAFYQNQEVDNIINNLKREDYDSLSTHLKDEGIHYSVLPDTLSYLKGLYGAVNKLKENNQYE